jgi:hypothetical protein
MQRKSNCAADLEENNAVANQALISASCGGAMLQ